MSMEDAETCNLEQTYSRAIKNCSEFTVYDHYLNDCVPASLIQFADQENEPAMRVVYGVVLPLLSLVVVTLNIVVFRVLNEQKNKRATVEPLLWMISCAIMMALSPLPFTFYYYTFGHMNDLNQTTFLCYLQKVSMEILPFFFNSLITFFTLLLGIQRFIAVQYPLDSIRLCAKHKIRLFSKLILLSSLVLTVTHSLFDVRTIYHFCIESGRESFWVARCFVGYSSITRSVGANYLSQMFDLFRISITLVPSVLLFLITLLLIRTVKATDQRFVVLKENKNVSAISRHMKITKASRKTTVMLTVIIVLFLVGRMPSTCLIIAMKLEDFFDWKALEFVYDAYLRALTNMVMMTVHPISFAAYLLMSRRFRVSLRRILGLRFLASEEDWKMFSSSMKNTTSPVARKNRGQLTSSLLATETSRRNSCNMTTIAKATRPERHTSCIAAPML